MNEKIFQFECLHRPLNAPIIAHADVNCFQTLPLILLGVRSAFKADIRSYELMFALEATEDDQIERETDVAYTYKRKFSRSSIG